jgi:hypothetical protein
MDKFLKIEDGYIWERGDFTIYVDNINGGVAFDVVEPFDEIPSTREEFTAAALQAIEKLKAQGIDIGADWLPKWEPKVGEVVWCWNDTNYTVKAGPYMGQTQVGRKHIVSGVTWHHIAPFTGEIPEPFKSRWEAEGNANQ